MLVYKSSKKCKQQFRAPPSITEGCTSPSKVSCWQELLKEAPSAIFDRALNNYLIFSNIAAIRVFASKELSIIYTNQ